MTTDTGSGDLRLHGWLAAEVIALAALIAYHNTFTAPLARQEFGFRQPANLNSRA